MYTGTKMFGFTLGQIYLELAPHSLHIFTVGIQQVDSDSEKVNLHFPPLVNLFPICLNKREIKERKKL